MPTEKWQKLLSLTIIIVGREKKLPVTFTQKQIDAIFLFLKHHQQCHCHATKKIRYRRKEVEQTVIKNPIE